MRKLVSNILLCICLISLDISGHAAPLRVVVNQAPPYRIIDPPYYGGYYIELFLLAAAQAGLEIRFLSVPLKRGLQMLETGEADLILGPNRTEERERYLTFLTEIPFPAEDKVFVVAHLDQVITNLTDLQHKRIDVLAGAVYHPDFDRATRLDKHELKTYEQGLQRLTRNRSDVVIIPEAQADWLIKSLHLSLFKSPYHLHGAPSYIAWSRVTYRVDLAQRLIRGMQQVQDSPQARVIRQHYFSLSPP